MIEPKMKPSYSSQYSELSENWRTHEQEMDSRQSERLFSFLEHAARLGCSSGILQSPSALPVLRKVAGTRS